MSQFFFFPEDIHIKPFWNFNNSNWLINVTTQLQFLFQPDQLYGGSNVQTYMRCHRQRRLVSHNVRSVFKVGRENNSFTKAGYVRLGIRTLLVTMYYNVIFFYFYNFFLKSVWNWWRIKNSDFLSQHKTWNIICNFRTNYIVFQPVCKFS